MISRGPFQFLIYCDSVILPSWKLVFFFSSSIFSSLLSVLERQVCVVLFTWKYIVLQSTHSYLYVHSKGRLPSYMTALWHYLFHQKRFIETECKIQQKTVSETSFLLLEVTSAKGFVLFCFVLLFLKIFPQWVTPVESFVLKKRRHELNQQKKKGNTQFFWLF